MSCKWLGHRTSLEEAMNTKLSALICQRISIQWSFTPLPSYYTELSDSLLLTYLLTYSMEQSPS